MSSRVQCPPQKQARFSHAQSMAVLATVPPYWVLHNADMRKSFIRRLASVFGLATAMVVAGCQTVALTDEGIFRPQPGVALTADQLGSAGADYQLQPLTLTTTDGVRLEGVLLRRPGAQRTVLYFGPNLSTVERAAPRMAAAFSSLNVDFAMFDYRGYGASAAGTITVPRLMADAEEIFDHVTSLPGRAPGSTAVHGLSLGSFMAGHVAARRQTAGLVLEGSATTAEEFASAQIPWFAKPVVRLQISPGLQGQGNLQYMDDLDEPLLVLVGERDTVTRPVFSRRLFEASNLPMSRKQLVVVPGATHDNAMQHPDALTAYEALLRLADER